MLKVGSYCLLGLATLTRLPLFADAPYSAEKEIKSSQTFQPFTGKVTRERVRLRLHPTLDSPVIQELDKGALLVIVGQEDEFYAVKPFPGIKGYIYRTYVLDGVVEGNKVNVRIDPHLEAPVIAQLAGGERITGKISDRNSKWLEIDPPSSVHFFVSSDFIEKVGDARYMSRMEERKNEVNTLLNTTFLIDQQQIQKPFPEIEPQQTIENYKKVIADYPEFPEQVQSAKDYLSKFEETYLHKKIAYLEEKTKTSLESWKSRNEKLATEVGSQKERLNTLENQLQTSNYAQTAASIYEKWVSEQFAHEINARMALWIPVEISYYEAWAKENPGRSIQEFYQEQKHKSIGLRGLIEAYDRPIKNKPGDYLLVSRATRLPIAYLYSTHINLQDKIGHEVSVEAVIRPNNHFAYPAYFILSVE